MKIRVRFERPESITVDVPEDVVNNEDRQVIEDWFWENIIEQPVYVEDWSKAE